MSNQSALALLTDYGGDSSEEEVPGPRVSTKRTFREEDNSDNPQKRFQRLPVPQHFININKANEHVEDPSLHDGRVRTFSHERGNWATYVYIPFEGKMGIMELFSSIEEIIPKHLNLKICDDFHISLTKTVILKHHWISSFVTTIKESLESFKKFFILFDNAEVYCNEERTRTFLGIQTRSGHDTLLKLVNALDKCLEEFELPPFYEDPSFHMSIAWCVGDLEKELRTYLPQINNKLKHLMELHSQDNWYIFAETIWCKTGNKYFHFGLG